MKGDLLLMGLFALTLVVALAVGLAVALLMSSELALKWRFWKHLEMSLFCCNWLMIFECLLKELNLTNDMIYLI